MSTRKVELTQVDKKAVVCSDYRFFKVYITGGLSPDQHRCLSNPTLRVDHEKKHVVLGWARTKNRDNDCAEFKKKGWFSCL